MLPDETIIKLNQAYLESPTYDKGSTNFVRIVDWAVSLEDEDEFGQLLLGLVLKGMISVNWDGDEVIFSATDLGKATLASSEGEVYLI